MTRLHDVLRRLVDESLPLEERYDAAITVPGMGKAVITAILLVAQPAKYGAWNSTSEAGLKSLGLWPNFPRGESWGRRYLRVNEVLGRLAQDLEVDLWTLDTLFYGLDADETRAPMEIGEVQEPGAGSQYFGLERHLQDFLRDNWGHTSLGREWNLYSEPGDDEAGYEYPTEVGRIDLLAKHKERSEWLVIELKRAQTSDATVGQVLRYMGWVKEKLAGSGELVRGLVIAREVDKGLQYALGAVSGIELQLYEVEFRLRPAPAVGAPRAS